MDYAFCVTDAGRYLIARLLTGQTMHITKVMVGRGKVPDGVRLSSVTELYDVVAEATSDDPRCEDGVAYMTIEYNNSLNGGLADGFWLNEFGIYALDPVEGEILMAYATLGDYPQWVSAYNSSKGIDVRRFPVSIAIGEDVGMVVDYHTSLWLTWDDLTQNFSLVIMPQIDAEIDEKIDIHDKDPDSHDGTPRRMMQDVIPRICMAELLEEFSLVARSVVGYANERIEALGNPDTWSVTVTGGVYNERLCRIEF